MLRINRKEYQGGLMKWQEEFIQLYTSGNLENVRKAFELKRKYIPQKLYRYRPIGRWRVLTDCYSGEEVLGLAKEIWIRHLKRT